MTPNKWEIWMVNMPFDEGIGSKVRPALVIDSTGICILVGKMISHAPRREFPYEYPMIDWAGAGLQCPTTIRLSKITQLDKSRFLKRIGVIQTADQMRVREILTKIRSGSK